MKANECRTLGEYRTEVLREPQSEVARRAKCKQGWISQVELGHLPRTWNRDNLLKAYRLEGQEALFVRLVSNAARMKAMQKPVREQMPLFENLNGEGLVKQFEQQDVMQSKKA